MCTWCTHGVHVICEGLIVNKCTCGAHHVHKGVTLNSASTVSWVSSNKLAKQFCYWTTKTKCSKCIATIALITKLQVNPCIFSRRSDIFSSAEWVMSLSDDIIVCLWIFWSAVVKEIDRNQQASVKQNVGPVHIISGLNSIRVQCIYGVYSICKLNANVSITWSALHVRV